MAVTYTRACKEVCAEDLGLFLAFEILGLIRALRCQGATTTGASLLFAPRKDPEPASEVDLPCRRGWRLGVEPGG